MMTPASTKKHVMINNLSTTNGGTSCNGWVDTRDYDYCVIDIILPTSDAASNNPSTFKLGDGTDTVVSNATDITAFVGDTAFTIPNCKVTASNITGPFATFNVDCTDKERYLHLEIIPLTTQIISAVANLHRAREVPVGTTDQNASVIVTG